MKLWPRKALMLGIAACSALYTQTPNSGSDDLSVRVSVNLVQVEAVVESADRHRERLRSPR
jgi:hypothetical protein